MDRQWSELGGGVQALGDDRVDDPGHPVAPEGRGPAGDGLGDLALPVRVAGGVVLVPLGRPGQRRPAGEEVAELLVDLVDEVPEEAELGCRR